MRWLLVVWLYKLAARRARSVKPKRSELPLTLAAWDALLRWRKGSS